MNSYLETGKGLSLADNQINTVIFFYSCAMQPFHRKNHVTTFLAPKHDNIGKYIFF